MAPEGNKQEKTEKAKEKEKEEKNSFSSSSPWNLASSSKPQVSSLLEIQREESSFASSSSPEPFGRSSNTSSPSASPSSPKVGPWEIKKEPFPPVQGCSLVFPFFFSLPSNQLQPLGRYDSWLPCENYQRATEQEVC